MVSYPILNPVTCSIASLVHLGSMERSFVTALDAFSNGPNGLTVPEIENRWQAIRSVPLANTTPRAFVSSARRMVEEANTAARYFREYQERTSPDATVQFSVGHSPEEADTERLRLRERMGEITGTLLPPGRSTWVPGKTLWFLALLGQTQRGVTEAVFVNQDGRSIHLSGVFGDSVLLGYGCFSGAMHYMDISPESPTGRSRAVFCKDQVFKYDAHAKWLSALALSLQRFYAPQIVPLSGRVRASAMAGAPKKTVYQSQALNASNEPEFRDAVRHISPGNEIVIESEEVVAGRRGSALSTISAIVALTSFRCAFEGGAATLYRTAYFPERSSFSFESGIPEEFRRKLRFSPTGVR